jgi:hypothetical protein
MKLSNVVAQLPKDVAVDRFRVELGAHIKSKGDGSVSRECLEEIETYLRGYIDPNFEFSAPLDTTATEGDDLNLPWLLRESSATKG